MLDVGWQTCRGGEHCGRLIGERVEDCLQVALSIYIFQTIKKHSASKLIETVDPVFEQVMGIQSLSVHHVRFSDLLNHIRRYRIYGQRQPDPKLVVVKI